MTVVIGQLAKQVDEHHVVEGTGSGARNAGIGNHDCQTLGAGDGYVHTVAVENEGQSAGTVFPVAGTERKDADGGFLPLKLVNTPDPCALGKGSLKRPDLGVVGGDEQKVLQCQRSCEAILGRVKPAAQLAVNRRDPLNLLVTLLDVAIVLDSAEDNSALTRDEAVAARRDNDLLSGAIGMRAESSLVHALRDEAAD